MILDIVFLLSATIFIYTNNIQMKIKQKQDYAILFRLPKHVKETFEECCSDEMITVSAKIRQLIGQFLKSRVDNKKQ